MLMIFSFWPLFATPADAFRGIHKDKKREDIRNLPTIHVYGFSKARDPEFDFHQVGTSVNLASSLVHREHIFHHILIEVPRDKAGLSP